MTKEKTIVINTDERGLWPSWASEALIDCFGRRIFDCEWPGTQAIFDALAERDSQRESSEPT